MQISLCIFLPLGGLAFMQPLFDAFPGAIFFQNNYAVTPLDLARFLNRVEVARYLETQLDFQNQALVDQELDNNGHSYQSIEYFKTELHQQVLSCLC